MKNNELINILYLEDDPLDIRNMQWICSQFDDINLIIKNDFNSLELLLEEYYFNYIFIDQYLKSIHFTEYISYLKNQKYYILSNEIKLFKIPTHKPTKIFQKPLLLSQFKNIIEQNNIINEQNILNFDYFDAISDIEIKREILTLIKKEINEIIKKIPKIILTKNTQELTEITHKLKGKLSILKMKKTYDLCIKIEENAQKNELYIEQINYLKHDLLFILKSLNYNNECSNY